VAALAIAAADRDAVLGALERYGTSPLSFLVRYEAPWHSFTRGDGTVCYLEARRAAVAWSDPLCDEGDLPGLLEGFVDAMRAERRGVCLVAVGEATASAALRLGFSALKVGEEPWFDLATWHPPRGDGGKKYRWAVNHARRAGLEVVEYRPRAGRDLDVESEVLEVVRRWREALGRPEPEALMRSAPLEQADAKRIFLARRDGDAEAVLSCAELPAAGTWFLEDLVRVPEAVNGATELLVAEALTRLQADGEAAAAFALAPMRGVERQLDPRARWLGRALGLTIRGFDRRYRFNAIARYEARFVPTEWRPRYVAFLPALPRPAVVRAAVRSLTA
jgi:phosphatidylglycerol lysyltransferase